MTDVTVPKVVAFVDIGTNSIRLLVVRINMNGSYIILSQEKETVRLGESEFKEGFIIPAAMERAVLVCRKFVELAKYYKAEEIISVATSAAREARNQAELLERIKMEAGLDVSVISGKEEARLIYLGVSSGINIGHRKALFIDIGGGSCEIMIGDQFGHSYLDSLDLGAIRISSLFLPDGHRGPVTSEMYSRMKKHAKAATVRTKKRVEEEEISIAVASSGTAINLAQIAARLFDLPLDKQMTLKRAHLKKVASMLCSLPLEKRRSVPGINPERADIIIGGAAVLETLMEELHIEEVVISERGLRDGMLIEYLAEKGLLPSVGETDVRARSVMQLAGSCNIDEEHAKRVRDMALRLFDSGAEKRLHPYRKDERDLLEHAAFLHDIGDFISFSDHHLHSYYIISHSELLGFDQREISVIANVAKFHRKRAPRKKDPELSGLDDRSQKVVIVLAALLRIAESLDRSHMGIVVSSEFVKVDKKKAVLRIVTKDDCQLECWGVESHRRAFEKAFGRELVIEVARS
ncbi:MAG: Ppx/GppA family phosphatase [Methanomassiliicoccales archaeon]|nr:MAG: Ppx/GppA family phosphatase [Methanomassiliicoccales archaeon]